MSIWSDIGSFLSNTLGDVEHGAADVVHAITGNNQPQQQAPQAQPQAQVQRPQAPQQVQVQQPQQNQGAILASLQQQQQQQADAAQALQNQTNQNSNNPLNQILNQHVQQTQPQNKVPVQQNQQHASILHDLTHNSITNAAGTAGKAVEGVVGGIAKQLAQVPNDITVPISNAIGSKVGIKPMTPQNTPKTSMLRPGVEAGATDKLSQAGDTAAQFAQFAPRAVTQLAASTPTQGAMNRQIQPKGLAKVALGSQPIPSLQANYRQVNKQQGTQAAVINTGLTGAMDVLGAKGLIDHAMTGAPKAVKALHDGIQKLPNPIKETALKTATAQKPVENVPINVLTSYEGAPDGVRVEQYKNAIKAGQPLDPIVAMPDSSGNLGVEDGKHRLEAYKQLGIQNVPTKIVTPKDLQAVAQGGYANLPFREPGEKDIEPFNEQYGQENSSKDIAQQHADMLKSYDDNAKGGQMVSDNEGGYKRITEHSPFYSDYFKANKRAPSKAAYLEQATNELNAGKGDLLDPGMADAYQLAKQRENANQGLVKTAPSKGFILKEGTVRNGRQDVVKAYRDPETGHLKTQVQTIDAPTRGAEIGHALGLSDEQMAQIEKENNVPNTTPKVTPLERDQTKQLNMPRELTPEEKKAIINDEINQQTHNKIELKAQEGNTQGAIAEAKGIADERMARFETANKLGSKLDEHDKMILSERNDPNYGPGRPHNPKTFSKAAAAYDDYYDYSLAADRAAGGSTLRYGGGKYSPLYLKATPEEMDKMNIAPEDRLQGKYTGFRDRARKYASYNDASKVGLQRLFKNPVEDAKYHAQAGDLPIAQNLLRAALERSNPTEVNDRGTGFEVNKNGKQIPFTQAAGHLPFDVSEKVNKALANYKEISPNSVAGQKVVHVLEKTNKAAKTGLFFGSPFHYENIEKNFRGLTWSTGHPVVYIKGMANALRSSLVPGQYDRVIANARDDGTMQYARENGMEIADIHTRKGVGKVNIFGQTHDNMQRYINAIGLQLAKAAKDHGVESGTKQATQLFDEYNKVLGKVNEAVHGTSPLTSKVVSGGSLAPNYLRSQLALLKDSVKPGSARGIKPVGMFKAGEAARATVIGSRLTTAAMAILFSSIAQGKMPTFTKMLNEAGLNPNNPNPNYEGSEKKKNKESQVINFPTDPLGLGAGLLTDRTHFFDARTSPALSLGQKVLTNTNWNGEPLADPTKPNYLVNKVKNAAINSLVPIGVQNFTNLTKNPANPNIKQGLLQEVGGRLKTNPNDPIYKSAMQYYNMQNAVLKSVPPASKDESVLQSYFARNTNGQGVKIKPGTVGGYASAKDLVTNFNQGGTALKALYKGQHSLKNNDPLWSLPLNAPAGKPSVLNFLTYQSQYEGPEKTGTKEKMQGNLPAGQEGWIDKLTAARNAYYNKLPAGSDAAAKEPAYPNFSKQVNADLTAAYKISNSTQYDNFIDSHPDVVEAQSAIASWQNKIRVLEGAPTSIYQAAGASPQVEAAIKYYDSLPASKTAGNTNPATQHDRSNWINANQDLYNQMTQFYAQSDMADVIKDSIEAAYSGQNANSQALLKATKNAGSDVVQNKNGTYALNAPAASAAAYSSSSSTYTPYKYYSSSGSSSAFKQYKVDIQPLQKMKVYVHNPYGGTAKKVQTKQWNNPLKYAKNIKPSIRVPIGQAQAPSQMPKGAVNVGIYS